MNELDQSDPGAAARANAMRKAKATVSNGVRPEAGMAEKIHSMLPDWLSARSAVLRKRKQIADLDAQTREDGQP